VPAALDQIRQVRAPALISEKLSGTSPPVVRRETARRRCIDSLIIRYPYQNPPP
jgi:hypothetical protein